MAREESLKHGLLKRNIKDMISRTPPHLLNQQKRKHPNMSDSTSIGQTIGGSWINPTNASSGNYNQFDLLPTSNGDSSSLLQSQTIYTGVVPQDGVTKAYLPEFLSITSKTSATSGSPYKEGTPRVANLGPSEHMRLLLGGRKSGGSNSRAPDYQLPHPLLSSFYHVVSHTNDGNKDRNHSQQKELTQYHCSQPRNNEQLLLPSYWSSHHTSNNNILHSSRTTAVPGKCPAASNLAQSFFQPPPPSSSVLGKRPTTNKPSQSFFQPPPPPRSVLGKHPTTNKPSQSFFQPSPSPPPQAVLGKRPTTSNHVQSSLQPLPPLPSDADEMGPQCRLETQELLSLVQSMGTPRFLATSDRVLRSGSSLHDPLRATSAQIPECGSRAATSAPNLLLGSGNGGGIKKGKGKELQSYWNLDDMVKMMESMNKRQKEATSQPYLDLTLGSDGQGRN